MFALCTRINRQGIKKGSEKKKKKKEVSWQASPLTHQPKWGKPLRTTAQGNDC